MASGLAGVVMPGRVGTTLELAAGTKRGTDGAYWAYLAAEIGLGAVAVVGARRARSRL
jgi:hypothetical protein